MVSAGRADYTVNCNWKFVMENTCETYHTSIVHKNSLGPMKSSGVGSHQGDWDAVIVDGTSRTIVPLPSDFEGNNAPLPTFCDRTAFTNIFPNLQMNVTWDCMWWMRILPLSVDQTRVTMVSTKHPHHNFVFQGISDRLLVCFQGFCFPATTVELPEFPEIFEKYKHRWATAVKEDNAISMNQQHGLRSPHRRPGRFTPLEFGTHSFVSAGIVRYYFQTNSNRSLTSGRPLRGAWCCTRTTGFWIEFCKTAGCGTPARTPSQRQSTPMQVHTHSPLLEFHGGMALRHSLLHNRTIHS